MKTLLTSCLILIASLVFAQGEMKITDVSTGLFVNDSLYTSWIDTSATPDDTLADAAYKTLKLSYSYESLVIAITDTGATYDDSVVVEFGVLEFNRGRDSRSYTVTDTVWYPAQYVKDSTWADVGGTTLVDDASQHSYYVYCASYWIVRVRRTNVEAVDNRTTYFQVQAARKQ